MHFSVTLKMRSESDLSERRFGTILLLFKLAGIPLNTRSVSRIQSVYNITAAVCYYVTCASCFMDLYVNRNDVVELMKSIRVCLSMTFATVTDIFFRYPQFKWFFLSYVQINCNVVSNLGFFQMLQCGLLSVRTQRTATHTPYGWTHSLRIHYRRLNLASTLTS
jgi:hypothetical protein